MRSTSSISRDGAAPRTRRTSTVRRRLSNLETTQRQFTAPERYNRWPQAHLHTQWPGHGVPGDPVFDQFYASQMPSIQDFTLQQELNRDAIVALLEKIGPSILLTHSQSGAFGWPVADARPDLVKAILAVEPNGPPFFNVENVPAPEWFRDARPRRGPGASPPFRSRIHRPPRRRRISPSSGRTSPMVPISSAAGCKGRRRGSFRISRSVPILILTAEASYHAPYDHCTVKYLEQAGVHPDMDQARRRRHPRQRPHDDAGEEQPGHRRRHVHVARQGVAEAMNRKSVWPVAAGLIFIIGVTTLVDIVLHLAGVYPPMNQPIDDSPRVACDGLSGHRQYRWRMADSAARAGPADEARDGARLCWYRTGPRRPRRDVEPRAWSEVVPRRARRIGDSAMLGWRQDARSHVSINVGRSFQDRRQRELIRGRTNRTRTGPDKGPRPKDLRVLRPTPCLPHWGIHRPLTVQLH